jgi:indole-3-glycerol phosphate synthase
MSWKEAWETYAEQNGGALFADLARYGVRCFLIGESLMRQDDVTQATRTILANPLTSGGA